VEVSVFSIVLHRIGKHFARNQNGPIDQLRIASGDCRLDKL